MTHPPTAVPGPDPGPDPVPVPFGGPVPEARRPTWRRPLLRAGGGVVLGVCLLGLVAGWLAWTGTQARDELLAARSALPAVQAAVLTGEGTAGGQLEQLRRHAARADDLTHDPVWSVVGALPLVGSPVATTGGMTRSVNLLAGQSLPALARAADTLHPARLLRGGGRLDVAALATAEPSLAVAATSLRQQRDAVAALDPSWLGPVRAAHTQLLAALGSLAGTSRDAATAARVLPPMLGLDGPRRYFVAFQNPAEARGTGGLLDAYAIVLADHGAVRIERMGANSQLPPFSGDVADVDPAFAARYAALGGTSAWLEANVSPNFPDVARVWEAMWRQATGQQLDGAVALDPRALAGVLDGIGPVTAPVVGTVDARRIEPLVLHDQYVLTSVVAQRKSLMLGVGSAAAEKLLGGGASPHRLLPRLRDVASAGHVLVESRHPDEEARLLDAGIGGAVDATERPFAQAVVVNAAGNKLDTWLDTSLRYQVTRCGAAARTVSITVTLRNGAPSSGLPPYMTVRSDRPPYPTVPGQNRSELSVLVTRGARLLGATLDGAPLLSSGHDGSLPDMVAADAADTFLGQGDVGGRPSYWVDLETRPGGTHTVVLQLAEPPSTLPPLLPRQALVRLPEVTADVRTCQG
ncbi:MAG TPA: DUF4012 domain-containing protein [Kineosporiaceae bacterium]